MKRSLNEIDQTARKAARGCGLPWGMADDVGKAVRWLHVFRLKGIESLLQVLELEAFQDHQKHSSQSLSGNWHARSGLLNPLFVGASLSDCMSMKSISPITMGPIMNPILLAGFAGQTALKANQTVHLSWNGLNLQLHRNQLGMSGDLEQLYARKVDRVVFDKAPFSEDLTFTMAKIASVSVDQAQWQELEKHAHKTYVEATEQSRRAGAGAGLLDND